MRTVFILLVWGVALAGFAEPARAGSYTVGSCHHTAGRFGSDSRAGWTYYAKNGAQHDAVTDCPNPGLTFETDADRGPTDGEMTWDFSLGTARPLNITSVKFTIAGGDTTTGYRYRFPSCHDCADLATYFDRAPGDPAVTVTVPYGRPFDRAGGFSIVAECTVEICRAAESVRFYDFELTVADDWPPFSSYVLPSPPSIVTQWLKPGAPLTAPVSPADPGSGVGTIEYSIGGVFQHAWRCANFDLVQTSMFGLGPPCPENAPWPDQKLYLGDLEDGIYTTDYRMVDASGNEGHRYTWVGLDRQPPATPYQLVIPGENAHGWTSQTPLHITWENGLETNVQVGGRSGIVSSTIDLSPELGVVGGPDPAPFNGFAPYDKHSNFHQRLPSDGRWPVRIWTTDRAGNNSGEVTAVISRDVDVPSTPAMQSRRSLNAAELHAGPVQRWSPPANLATAIESGICGYSEILDTAPNTSPGSTADRGSATERPLPATLPEGENWFHLRAVSCAGLASPPAHSRIDVDTISPAVSLAGIPTGAWSPSPVRLSLAAEDLGSGLAGLYYSIDGERADVDADSVVFTVPEGSHAVEFGASDAAGNQTSSGAVPVRVDSTAPAVRLLAPVPSSPLRVSGESTDTQSGVNATTLEFRRVDGGATADQTAWRSFANSGGDALSRREVGGEIPADLPDGDYAVRIVAEDAAGNVATATGASADGVEYTISLPFGPRQHVSLKLARAATIGRSKAPKPGARVVLLLDYGARAELRGRVVDATGTPAAGREIALYTSIGDASLSRFATVSTGADGRFSRRLGAGPSRRFEARLLDGRGSASGRSELAVLQMRAGVKARVNRVRTKVRRMLMFGGRVERGGVDLPRRGKLVQLEYWNGDEWSATGKPRRTDSSGRFAIPFRFRTRPKRPVGFLFRVTALAEGDWPFEDGHSPARRVVVVP